MVRVTGTWFGVCLVALVLGGCSGDDGEPGFNGVDGADGADGSDGAPGEKGAPGSDGAPGADGSPGADGLRSLTRQSNQGGPDAAIKRLYRIDLNGVSDGDLVSKTLVRDLMPDLAAPGGLIYEKVEGLAVTVSGNVWIVNDNDGVDDNSGETQLLSLGHLL